MHLKYNDYKTLFFGVMSPETASAVTQVELDFYLFLPTLCFQLRYIYNYLIMSMIKTKKKESTKMFMTLIIVISRDNINKHNIT